ncbi:hypothetical protein Ahy_B05g079317 [Arachis hypogaea]|uniref:Uncharacterized protein n=1 Tax=Arachis hypogaea TaxID=3818 RepID=A0A444Z9I4_ARAHY|nr:hypothetical protein Ahy_B05g079317 [Arachis hypogaea]
MLKQLYFHRKCGPYFSIQGWIITLYKNEDVFSYRGGLELWNHHHHHHQPEHDLISQARPLFHQDLYSSAAALGVGPTTVSDDQSPSRSAFLVTVSAVGSGTASGAGSGAGEISC